MTNFNFPTTGIDFFTPALFNDITVVNATHVLDLRQSIIEIEKALLGPTPFPYHNTHIVHSGDSIQKAIEELDQNLYAMQQQLGFFLPDGYTDGYAARIDSLQSQFEAHRSAQGPVDADGYGVHGVDGQLVGTQNHQDIINKRIDSGLTQVGPKFVARATNADYSDGYLGQQIQVFGVSGTLNAWIDELGDAYFAGDLIVEGDRILKGMDLVEQSLTVDGYSILGNDPTLDYVTAYGPFTLIGTSGTTLSVDALGNIDGYGPDTSLGDGTGTLTLDFLFANISANTTISNALSATGPIVLGNTSGSNTITIKGSVLQPLGDITSAGQLNVLGGLFSVQSSGSTTTVGTTQLNITSSTITMGGNVFDAYGDITSSGTNYTFGNSSTAATNTFIVNANALLQEQLTVVGTVSSGAITASGTTTLAGLTVNGAVKINNGQQQDGYVWTATGGTGAGTWAPPKNVSWHTAATDGYTITDASGTQPLTPNGFYTALPSDELFVSTTSNTMTVNLPTSPNISDRVRIIDQNASWSGTNEVFVFPNPTNSPTAIKTFTSPGDVNNPVTNDIHIPNHGLITGQRGALTTTGTLPSPLSTSTPVYIIATPGLGANTIQFASSLSNALSATPIAITTSGSGTHTFKTGTIMGSAYLELDAPNGWVEIIYNGTEWRVIS